MGRKKEVKTGVKLSFQISKAIDRQLTAEQIRQLCGLQQTSPVVPITREELRRRTGTGTPGVYTGPWLKNLRDLEEKGLMSTLKPLEGEGKGLLIYITQRGKKILNKAITRYLDKVAEGKLPSPSDLKNFDNENLLIGIAEYI